MTRRKTGNTNRGGNVVYQARVLYATLFDDYSILANTGCDGPVTSSKDPHELEGTTSQQYQLFPNPNDGRLTLRQKTPADVAVDAVIYNATGSRIYSGSLLFKGGAASLQLQDAVPGLYLLQITDSEGNKTFFKFTVN